MKVPKLFLVLLLIFLLVIPCILTTPCIAQDPPSVVKLIEYIGTLEKENGSPYPQGIYDINFEIFLDAECTISSGWSELHTIEISAKNKKDIDGATSYEAAFSVILGSINELDLVFDQDLYLRVTETTLGHENIEQFTSTTSALTSEFAVKVYDSDIDAYTDVQKVNINKAKDADTVDGKHYSDIASEIDTDIAAHAALTETHGVIGSIVGTDNDQTLSNKHISGEQIDSGKISNDRLNMGSGNGINADMIDSKHYSDISQEIDDKIDSHANGLGHLTIEQKTDLTDGGDTTSHYHASDRNLANATGILDKSNLNSGQVQMRVIGTCGSGSSIREVREDGSVVCEPDTDTDTHLSKSTVQQWANEVDDGQGGGWVELCMCGFNQTDGDDDWALTCPDRCVNLINGWCHWRIKIWAKDLESPCHWQ